MTTIELLEMLTKYAISYREDKNSLTRNAHLTNIKEEPSQEVKDGILVDFINYVGYMQCVDYALSVDGIHQNKREQFNFDKWIKDKTLKICTRDGRDAVILDTEFETGDGNKSILAKCIYNGKSSVYTYYKNGRANSISETENDLFFR